MDTSQQMNKFFFGNNAFVTLEIGNICLWYKHLPPGIYKELVLELPADGKNLLMLEFLIVYKVYKYPLMLQKHLYIAYNNNTW